MRLELSQDDVLLRDSVRDLGRQELAARAHAHDEAGAIPDSSIAKLGEMGLLGMRVPESEGGAGLSMVATAAVLEELAAAHGSVALSVAVHNLLCVEHVRAAGSESLRAEFLPRLVSGQALGTQALGEPQLSPDAIGLKTVAQHGGEHWSVSGDKPMVLAGAAASHAVLIATTDAAVEPSHAAEHTVALLVDLKAAGVSKGRIDTLGMRAAGWHDLRFEGMQVPSARLLGERGRATHDVLLQRLDDYRIALAAIAVGIARAATQAARDYALDRKQFGQPIASFQAIQWKLADAATELDAARLLTLKAAAGRDAGESIRASAARAKLFATRAAVRACSSALQVHGGYGYTTEFPVERCLRDARHCELDGGASAVQRVLASRAVLERFAG